MEEFRTTKVRTGMLDIVVTMDVTNTGFDDFCGAVHEIYPDIPEKDVFRIAITYMVKRGFEGGFGAIPITAELFSDVFECEYNDMINFADLSALQRDFKTAELIYNKAISSFFARAENTYLHLLLACLYCKRFAEFDYYVEGKTISLDQDGFLRSIYNWCLSQPKGDDVEFTRVLHTYDKYIPEDTMLLSFLSGIKTDDI
jgi:hypothetical protein